MYGVDVCSTFLYHTEDVQGIESHGSQLFTSYDREKVVLWDTKGGRYYMGILRLCVVSSFVNPYISVCRYRVRT